MKMNRKIITIILLVGFFVFLAISVLSVGEQFARPDSDNSVGLWTITPLFSKINEVTANDANLIKSSGSPVADIYSARLSDVTDPAVSTGHIIRVRYSRNDTGAVSTVDLTFRLKQGTTLIREDVFIAISDAWTTTVSTLTAAQADSITDYSNLFFEFQADSFVEPGEKVLAVRVSWAELEVPAATAPVSKGLLQIRDDGLLQFR